MEKLNCIRKQVVVEVFIKVKHEVKTDLSGIHHFLSCHSNFLHVSVLIETFNHCSTVESRHKEVDVASSLPCLLGNNFLSFVTDIKDGSCKCITSLVPKGMEDWNWAHVKVFDHLFVPNEGIVWIGVFEPKVSLSHFASNCVNNVVVVYYSIAIFGIGLFVGVGN